MKKNKICLILEGTYPYITGGVSTWVQQIITGLPEYGFDVVHIYTGKIPNKATFELPPNLERVINIPLTVDEAHSNLEIALDRVPDADLYHSLSTGFAGMVGMEIKQQRRRPFLLTEHGIYWHEIELGVDEIECGFKIIKTENGKMMLGLSWESWLDTFKNIARANYQSADVILTVCAHNRRMQLSLGAQPDKCHVIPNGVSLQVFPETNAPKKDDEINFGLVGRVTQLKDVLTFIRACHLVKKDLPNAKFWVIGPTDHNPDYFRSCLNLKEELGLSELTFTGERNSKEYYQWLDVVVLTSQSEALPFALLEAMAAGLPVVATDVGGCRELVEGYAENFGAAGYIANVGEPVGIAKAMLKLASNRRLRMELGTTGQQRIRKYYSERKMLDDYRAVYARLLRREHKALDEDSGWTNAINPGKALSALEIN